MYLGWNDTPICLCKCYYYTCKSGPTVVSQTRKLAAIKRRIKKNVRFRFGGVVWLDGMLVPHGIQ